MKTPTTTTSDERVLSWEGVTIESPEPSPVETPPDQPPKLMVSVTELRKRLGQRQVEHIEIILGRREVVSSRTTEDPVQGRITIESMERGVTALGTVTFRWEGDCRRCLEPTGGPMDVLIDEIFQVHAPTDSDIIDFHGDQIDLVPVVADAVALSLPLAPLCRVDCAGPDPDRYPALTFDEAEAERAAERAAATDPRWDALSSLDLDDSSQS